MTISPSRTGTLYEGTPLTLTCTIELNTTGVDSPVTVEREFTGTTNTEDSRLTLSELEGMSPTYTKTLSFTPLSLSDNGSYVCSSTVSSGSEFIVTSDSTDSSYTLSVTS